MPSGINEVKVYTGELIVWVPENGNSTFYDITHINFSRKIRDTTNVADSTGPRFENEETPHQLPAADNNIPQNPENANFTDLSDGSDLSDGVRFSIAPEEDATYQNAVNNGDMETAAELTRKAAERSGLQILPKERLPQERNDLFASGR